VNAPDPPWPVTLPLTRAMTPPTRRPNRPPTALTVAGSDSGGGAGVQADLRTFAAHGVWGLSAVTAVTAQNTLGVEAVEVLSPEIVRAQMAAVATDLGVDATKTGMLGTADVVRAVAQGVRELSLHPLVVDPVTVSSTGATLLDPGGVDALRSELLPLADLVTPNLAEAAALTGAATPITDRAGMEKAATALLALGARAVLLTGGHLEEAGSPDLLLDGDGGPVWLEGERLHGRNTHGTGCVLSAAVTARLARGETLEEAVKGAKAYLTRAIAAGLDRL
jgi:hydroxymethylpyrimidine/phosphomethylpyrimidine kinase